MSKVLLNVACFVLFATTTCWAQTPLQEIAREHCLEKETDAWEAYIYGWSAKDMAEMARSSAMSYRETCTDPLDLLDGDAEVAAGDSKKSSGDAFFSLGEESLWEGGWLQAEAEILWMEEDYEGAYDKYIAASAKYSSAITGCEVLAEPRYFDAWDHYQNAEAIFMNGSGSGSLPPTP